ncbi:MAG: ABC transporter ATP-binding protein [Carnobacterium inhibens]|uniref:Putative hemin import ATP-binding protein HrtA n=1 Tax=Carnobacterium inhibens TaxID=147709 RepID=A0ABR7T9F7_9LACT|nr:MULTISPECIES: ABC transporter ATP-binding protein [Carnobacterium]MBC9824415.1 ATP-binding cassette domain-containing protein [Carnobacterium inhibens]MDN5372065.1 hemin transport system ATP-binding protein [Carnobacterium sp.]
MSGIQLKNVTKRYKDSESETIALDHVSLTVNKGEFVAIIGPSGSGKSTFLSIAGALLQPSEGEVFIKDRAISTLSEKELAHVRLEQIGFILQTSNLIPYLTVLDQLLVVVKMKGAITEELKQTASELLTDLGLGNKLKKFPNELSGGERQRVAIARSFMNDPDVILADEPTANLDTARAYEVVQLIAKEVRSRNKAAIMVTHDERMLKDCDRVYRIEDGVLKEEKNV